MSSSRRLVWNTAANTAGQLIGPIASIVLVPVYLSTLGHASYGLIGLLSSVSLLMQVFSQGIGQALQAAIAKRDVDDVSRRGLRRLVRTFERTYAVIGLVLLFLLLLVSETLSTHWIRNDSLPASTIHACLILLSLRIGLSFPAGVYHSVFVGTQRQVIGNTISVVVSLASLCATVIVTLVTKSVVAILLSDVVFALVAVSVLRWKALRILPPLAASDDGAFSREDFAAVVRPSVWLICTSGLGVLITQCDRLILSRLVGLADLAVYNAGAAAGRIVSLLYNPFLMATYPEVCQAAARKDRAALSRLMARNSSVVSAMTACCAFPMSFFAPEVLEVWTRDARVVAEGPAILSLHALGGLAISNASTLYLLLMAIGAVRYTAAFNAVAVLWYPALMIGLVGHLGTIGAAWCWFAYGLAAWFAVAAFCLLRHLDSGALPGYVRSAGVPLLIGTAISAAAAWLAHAVFPSAPWLRLGVAGLAAAAILPASLAASLGPTTARNVLRRILGGST